MTESCLIKLVDLTDEDTFSKVVDVVTNIENDVLKSFDGHLWLHLDNTLLTDLNFGIL